MRKQKKKFMQKNGLHRACENGQIEVAKILIEKAIDVNAKDKVKSLAKKNFQTQIFSSHFFGMQKQRTG